MFINLRALQHLPVITQSGKKLGQVHDVEIAIDTHHVRKYIVSRFLGKEQYLITPAQVVRITETEMVVEDAIIKDSGTVPEKVTPNPALGGLSPRS